MKHLLHILFILPLILSGGTTAAQVTDLAGYKIFVNPGHGGFDSNDRFIEATGFWESQGNLVKGLHLRKILTNMNATVFMSRVTNTTEDDLPLSSISALANAANVDFFLSIHSNGFDGKQNRPLMLFRGYDNQPVYPLSKDMALIMWQKVFENGNCWTHTGVYVKGDWTFYPDWGTQGLGVLRGLTMPGVLSEGSFHDYVPESWRLLNNDFLHHESWALARSFAEFRNAGPLNHGIIAGVVRDSLRSPSWYYKPGTKDEALPLNGADVTLMPGNRHYKVDNLNNGFFMFDSLTPGPYSLYISGVPNFMNDTLEVTVAANRSFLAESFLTFDTTMVPVLLSVTPPFTDSLKLTQEITFVFDLPMDTASVRNSLTISPALPLIYTWNEARNTLRIKPEVQFSPKTEYSLDLDATAQSRWNVATGIAHHYSFITFNRTKLTIEKSFPAHSRQNVSLFPQIRFIFDASINPLLVNSEIEIKDSNGTPLERMREEISVIDGRGHYRFELTNPLSLNGSYMITARSTLADQSGTLLGTRTDIPFTTRKLPYPTGTIVEPFEDIARFWDPETSGSTTGTDNPVTVFISSTTLKRSGNASGKLHYTFINPDGGVCRVFDTQKPSLGSDTTKHFGIWVYGDLSYNILEYWFYSYGTVNQIVVVDTINWAGWDFRSIPMNRIGGSGDRSFHSVVIKQTPIGVKTGIIYFDDATLYTPAAAVEPPPVITEYEMAVYPNPFTTEGKIEVRLPEESEVKVQVLNTSGRLLASIDKGVLDAGVHTLTWRPTPADPAGIYIFRMEITKPGNTRIKPVIKRGVLIK
jgi:N-acetylmuramoyl-L-alanine amidase